MKLIFPDYILTPNELKKEYGVLFDKTIKEIAPKDELIQKYPDVLHVELKPNSLLMPGLINTHVHLEFSANKTTLKYGNFMTWLYSVIQNREELMNGCDDDCMSEALHAMLKNGITTIGAISSNGLDLKACANAKQNIVYFNELIGSAPHMVDALFGDFKQRLQNSMSIKRDGFYPAVAIHSPYSVHPILIKKVMQIVKEQKLKLSTHFMESKAERKWIDKSEGEFKKFFKDFLNQDLHISNSDEFLEHFKGYETLFTHATQINDNELKNIAKNNHTIVHCPISNRLLGSNPLDIEKLDKMGINWVVATDGLSSNYALDLFEEMKISLFTHSGKNLLEFANSLLQSVTTRASKALKLNKGSIEKGKDADMIVLDLDEKPNEELAIHLLLHRYNISKVYIGGVEA